MGYRKDNRKTIKIDPYIYEQINIIKKETSWNDFLYEVIGKSVPGSNNAAYNRILLDLKEGQAMSFNFELISDKYNTCYIGSKDKPRTDSILESLRRTADRLRREKQWVLIELVENLHHVEFDCGFNFVYYKRLDPNTDKAKAIIKSNPHIYKQD